MRGQTNPTYLSKHVQGHIHGGQKGPEGGGPFRVKSGSGEAQGKQEAVLSKVQGLQSKMRLTEGKIPRHLWAQRGAPKAPWRLGVRGGVPDPAGPGRRRG